MTQVPGGAPLPPISPPPYGVPPKPGLLQAAVILTLISGIFNILNSGLVGIALVASCFGAICAPVAVLPLVLGIFELIYAIRLMAARPQPTQPNSTLAILQIIAIIWGGIFSVVAGVLALMAYNDPQVQAWFAAINGQPVPAPPPSPAAGPANTAGGGQSNP